MIVTLIMGKNISVHWHEVLYRIGYSLWVCVSRWTIMLIIGIVIFQKLNNLKHKCFKIYPIP